MGGARGGVAITFFWPPIASYDNIHLSPLQLQEMVYVYMYSVHTHVLVAIQQSAKEKESLQSQIISLRLV